LLAIEHNVPGCSIERPGCASEEVIRRRAMSGGINQTCQERPKDFAAHPTSIGGPSAAIQDTPAAGSNLIQNLALRPCVFAPLR
jgi:hypothetical protein